MSSNNAINLQRAQERYIGEERKGQDSAYISALAFGKAKTLVPEEQLQCTDIVCCAAACHPR